MASLGSKLYFIGGWHRVSKKPVFTFDTVSCMKLKRVLSVVVTYENKIYVFGHGSGLPIPPLPHHRAWEYMPGGDSPEELTNGYSNIISAVVKHKKTILLCIRYFGVYGYSLDETYWLHCVPELALIGYGSIRAYDFQSDTQGAVIKCTLQSAQCCKGIWNTISV